MMLIAVSEFLILNQNIIEASVFDVSLSIWLYHEI